MKRNLSAFAVVMRKLFVFLAIGCSCVAENEERWAPVGVEGANKDVASMVAVEILPPDKVRFGVKPKDIRARVSIQAKGSGNFFFPEVITASSIELLDIEERKEPITFLVGDDKHRPPDRYCLMRLRESWSGE